MKELSLVALKELELKPCKCDSRSVIPIKLSLLDETKDKIKYACFCTKCGFIGPARVTWEGAIKAWNNNERKTAKGKCKCGEKLLIDRQKTWDQNGIRRVCFSVYCEKCEIATGYHATREAAMKEWNENVTTNNNLMVQKENETV
jgi:hypothetical protein